jgi:hypothetical protein
VNQVIEDFYVAYAEGMLGEQERVSHTLPKEVIIYNTSTPVIINNNLPPSPKRDPAGTRLPDGFEVPAQWIADAAQGRLSAGMRPINLAGAALSFSNYWTSVPGRAGRKLDWRRTWINWALIAKGFDLEANKPGAIDTLREGAARAAAAIILRERASRDSGTSLALAGPLLGWQGECRDETEPD